MTETKEPINLYPLRKKDGREKGFKRPTSWKKPGRKPGREKKLETTCFRIPVAWLAFIDELIKKEKSDSRSKFMRKAIKNELLINGFPVK